MRIQFTLLRHGISTRSSNLWVLAARPHTAITVESLLAGIGGTLSSPPQLFEKVSGSPIGPPLDSGAGKWGSLLRLGLHLRRLPTAVEATCLITALTVRMIL